MVKKLLLRGTFAGAVAGLCAFIFARIFAEPVIGRAIDYESARDAAQDALDKAAGMAMPEAGPDLFSRTVQANVGIGVGMIVFGAAMGTLFAVVYCLCMGRVGRLRPRSLALAVGAAGFGALYLVPFLKYPANPPSIGHMDTIRQRSGLYLLMVLAAVAFLALAVVAGQRLAKRFGNWNATLLAALVFVVPVGLLMLALPTLGELSSNVTEYGKFTTETPQPLRDAQGSIVFPGFSADDLFLFRLYSVGAQLLIWSVIALIFAPLAETQITKANTSSERDELPALV